MIPAKRKVGRGLFETLVKQGRLCQTEHFSVRVFFNSGAEPAKFSVVVPKRIEKSSVKRNALKRRLYASLRRFLSSARPGALCAFFLKKKFDGRPLPSIKAETAAALKKTGVIA